MRSTELPIDAKISYSQQYRRCGKADCSACRAHGPRHGPYWYAYWWDAGRMRSRYLGKQPPDGIVERALPAAQPAAPADAAAAVALRVRTLGGFAVWRGETLLAPALWRRRKVASLFKCLLGAPGHRLHREQLADLLWPDAEPFAGAKSLRSTLHLLRQALDPPGASESYLRGEGNMLGLVPDPSGGAIANWLDAASFARAADAAMSGRDAALCRAAIAHYGGDYLPEDSYEDWTSARRESLRAQHHAVLLHLASLSDIAGDTEEALRCLRTLLIADPCHEVAARLLMAALARSGQRSEALRVYQMLTTALQEDLGLGPSAEIRALHARLLAEAPPQPPRRSNLPASLTSFVGREWERTEVSGLLRGTSSRCRLLTLTGVGGCGKTRLALEVAAALLEEQPDGAWLVELAALADPLLVPQAVATTLGLRETPDRPLLETLVASLEARHLLLVLDNCEHLLEPCAMLCQALLQRCPALRILATSREALGVLGETTWRVPSLSVADPGQMPPLADLAPYEAVQLFVERARASRLEFRLTAGNATQVVTICWHLDGIPLAIELAAARLATLSIESLSARLDDRFRLLTIGNRTAPPRQQTLQAAIDWSYGLLTPPERLVLQRLAAFAGGCVLDAAEAVCAGDGVAASAVQGLLSRLVAKSLVVLETPASGGEARYRLLETIRQYGRERLEAAGERMAIATSHLGWCERLAEEGDAGLQGATEGTWLNRLELEHDNLRTALAWSRTGGPASALRIAAGIYYFWEIRGYQSEGRRWLGEALARGNDAPVPLRAAALGAAGRLAMAQGDYGRAGVLNEESLVLWRDLKDTPGIASMLNCLGLIAAYQSDFGRAVPLYEESLALRRGLGDKQGMATTLNNLGLAAYGRADHSQATIFHEESLALRRELGSKLGIAMSLHNLGLMAQGQGKYRRSTALLQEGLALQREVEDKQGSARSISNLGVTAFYLGDLAQAATLQEESQALQRELGDRRGTAFSLNHLGEVVQCQGDFGRAAALHEEGLALFRYLDDTQGVANSLGCLGLLALRQDEHREALRILKESMTLYGEAGGKGGIANCLERLAAVAARQQQPWRGALLLGAASGLRTAIGAPRPPVYQPDHDQVSAALRAMLGTDRYIEAWRAGEHGTLEQALAYALEDGPLALPSPVRAAAALSSHG